MSGRRRLVIITYALAIAVFLLTVTGDGSSMLVRLQSWPQEPDLAAPPEIISVRTERVILSGTVMETILYITTSPLDGPTILVLGGVHGDEPAGYLAAEIIASWAVDRGTLIVLPRANRPAIATESRNGPDNIDLNRRFPGAENGEATEQLAAAILAIIKEFDPDWVLDLHEAQFCEYQVPGALGQTIIYPRASGAYDIVSGVITAVNRSFISEDDHLTLLRGMARGSAIEAARNSGSEALIVESCRQKPLADRIKLHTQVSGSLLYLLGVGVY